MSNEVMDTRGASERTCVAVSTLQKMRVYGGGPRYVKVGAKVLYRASDLDAWLAARVVGSTSERVAA